MGQRSRVVVGSIVGAVAVHLAMLACSGDGGSPPGQLDASAVDGGHQARADAGDILDAITAGDLGGALDAVADVVRDAVGKAVDAETRDAHASRDGGVTADGGAPACSCEPRTPSFTFTGTVNRGRGAERPPGPFSTARVLASPVWSAEGPLVAVSFDVVFTLNDGVLLRFSCGGRVRADRSIAAGFSCSAQLENAGRPLAFRENSPLAISVAELSDESITLRAPDFSLPVTQDGRDGGVIEPVAVAGFEVRGAAMRGNITPPNAYRP